FEIVVLPSFSTNVVGEPCALTAAMFTVTGPLTVAPFAGLVIDAPSAAVPFTITVTVGGLTLLSPRVSSTVREAREGPGLGNVTARGFCVVLLTGEPPGKIPWYATMLPSGSDALPAKVTVCPAWIVTLLVDGLVIVAIGAALVGFADSRTNFATDGTPVLSTR